jgi:fluoride exporter
MFKMNYLLVFFGAGLGGSVRYFISNLASKTFPIYFPFGTLFVNIIGSMILGFLIFGLDDKELLSNNFKLLIGVGFCGGLTTFSTFSLETINLLRDSQFLFAGLNIFLNVVASLVGIYLAYILSKL